MMKAKIRKFIQNEKCLFYCAMTAGVILLVLQGFSIHVFVDSADDYAFMVRAFSQRHFQEAFNPNLPYLNVWLSGLLTYFGVSPEDALRTVSSLFYVGTIPFVYALLSCFFSRKMASVGSLFFACAPKIIRYSCAPMIDSGKIFFLVAALFYFVQFVQGKYKSWKNAALLGCMLGGLSLVRSEGFVIALTLCGCLFLFWCIDGWKARKQQPVLPSCVMAGVWGLCILTRVWVNWHFFDILAFDHRISQGIAWLLNTGVPHPSHNNHISWLFLLQLNIRGAYEVYFVFAITGLLLLMLPKKIKIAIWAEKSLPLWLEWNRFYWIFLITPLANTVIFKASDIAEYRYFLLNVPCLLPFTMIGGLFLWQWARKIVPPFVSVAGIVVLLLFQVENGINCLFSAETLKRYEIGKQIAQMLSAEKETARIWFQGPVIEWYYSGLKRAVLNEVPSPDPATFADFDYVLWDKTRADFAILKNRADLIEIPLHDAGNVRLLKKKK